MWSERWTCAGEGPYTLLAKLIEANQLRGSHLQKILPWRKTYGQASLLNPWDCHPSNACPTQWTRMLANSSLAHLAPTLYKHIGTVGFRYCRTCMASGFQAAVCQIAGIDTCPIHHEPLVSGCRNCGASTGLYKLSSECEPSLVCHRCRFALGTSSSNSRAGPGSWGPVADVSKLEHVHEWLKRVEDRARIQWLNIDAWQGGASTDRDRTRAVMEILLRVVPPDSLIFWPGHPVDVFGPYEVDLRERPSPLTLTEYGELAKEIVPPGGIQDYADYFRTPSTTEVPIPLRLTVPPELHAKLIWRTQFEPSVALAELDAEPTTLHPDALSGLLGSLPDWARCIADAPNPQLRRGLLLAAWHAAKRTANAWFGELHDLGLWKIERNTMSWYGAFNSHLGSLGRWQRHAHCPIGMIATRDPSEPEGVFKVHFVLASRPAADALRMRSASRVTRGERQQVTTPVGRTS